MVFKRNPPKIKMKKKGSRSSNAGIPNSPIATTILEQQLRCPCCKHSLEQHHKEQLVGSRSCHDLANDLYYSSDEFRMYYFKVYWCQSSQFHDWTDCPFLHPGEKVRRRDPRRYAYSSELCSEFRKNGKCPDRDNCRFAHGVFEVWLHPERYRTQLCRDGVACNRKVCFFAHSSGQLRWPSDSNTDATEISEASSPPVAQSDSTRLPLSSLVSVLIANTQRMRLNEFGHGISCGINMFRDGGIEAPDVNWVSDLIDL